ncbi:CTP synthase 2-like isoform X3 [Zingiber officinale]|uniref:CTP synthase 2-like isoform X3 n=1 Tax=Zingiber officinale TaxID=94328 RepID=UPI001C4BC873|nr:CTP synthase 2-like isoform X3 [Zingiber officinale]
MKYVLVTGGVVSGLGKGVTASSIGLLLKECGLRITAIKIDPYLNTDAGTMSPFEHGEVFVLDDGGEVDLDLGNYERFLDIKLTSDNNITTGKIFQHVINKERKGDYLGKTVQVVPHITDAIQEWIERVAMIPVDGREGPADVCVIELGGTIGATIFSRHNESSILDAGDIESMPFIEAMSQFSHRVGSGNFYLVHVSLVPVLNVVGEQEQKAHEALIKTLNLQGIVKEPLLEEWSAHARICDALHDPVRIAIVGKYTGLSDSYISVLEALLHASTACMKKLVVDWVPSSDLEDNTTLEALELHKAAWKQLKGANAVLVPGGFGDRGVEGKILAAKYARENHVPFLGICLGMQIAVVEFARSVMNLQDANSTEFDPHTTNPCIIFMPEGSKTHKGGTMRVGSRRTYFDVTDSKSAKLYGNPNFVDERHRHRYEINPDKVAEFEKAGLEFVGKDETRRRMEIVELPNHPYFVGVQFHPEFKSRPGKPSPLFLGLVEAACGKLDCLPVNAAHLSNSPKRAMSPANAYENGNPKKPAKSFSHRKIFPNANGVHV